MTTEQSKRLANFRQFLNDSFVKIGVLHTVDSYEFTKMIAYLRSANVSDDSIRITVRQAREAFLTSVNSPLN